MLNAYRITIVCGKTKIMSVTISDGSPERPNGAISDALREHLHLRQDICAELEGLPDRVGVDYAAEVSRLCTAFSNAPQVPPEFEELLNKRFGEALDLAREGEAKFKARLAAIDKLNGEADVLLAAGELATPRSCLFVRKSAWRELAVEPDQRRI